MGASGGVGMRYRGEDCYFFDIDEIEFTFNPADVDGSEPFAHLETFLRWLGESTGRRVVVTMEGADHRTMPARGCRHGSVAGRQAQDRQQAPSDRFIDASEEDPSVKPGEGYADATMTMSADDFQTYYKDPESNLIQLFFAN